MSATRSLTLCLLLLAAAAGAFLYAHWLGGAAARLQAGLDARAWAFDEAQASLEYSKGQLGEEFTVTFFKGKRRSIGTIQISRAGRILCSFPGHSGTTFVRRGRVLVYADYRAMSTGCALVALDLESGRQLWRTELLGIGPIGHSKYENDVALKTVDDLIEVTGQEASGNYVEIVDSETGHALAHRVFDNDDDDDSSPKLPPPPPPRAQGRWQAAAAALASASPLPFIPLVWRTARARRRRAAGRCSACGYDVRAMPDRCPECGLSIAS